VDDGSAGSHGRSPERESMAEKVWALRTACPFGWLLK
jgi:hypothetical protein